MAGGILDRDLGFARIMRDLGRLGRMTVDVGIQSDAGIDSRSGVSVVEKAFANEFGSGRVPERSFMRRAFDEDRERLVTLITGLRNSVIDGLSPDRAAGLLGQDHERKVKSTINAVDSPPNSPVTIARKGSSKPLIHSGQMRQSVRYAVTER